MGECRIDIAKRIVTADHMSLITELEESFDIQMETGDIIDFSSKKGMELLGNYGVNFS